MIPDDAYNDRLRQIPGPVVMVWFLCLTYSLLILIAGSFVVPAAYVIALFSMLLGTLLLYPSGAIWGMGMLFFMLQPILLLTLLLSRQTHPEWAISFMFFGVLALVCCGILLLLINPRSRKYY